MAIALGASSAVRACWDAAAVRYQVDSRLLHAIARTESALDPHALHHNSNGSRDIGLMQINSSWLPRLANLGITERELFDPCTNIHVGAWILAQNFERLGPGWNAVGAYNARTPALRRAYAWKIYRSLYTVTRARPPEPIAAGAPGSTEIFMK